MSNRRRLRKAKEHKEEKLECPECGGTEFDHLTNLGEIDDVIYDGLACLNCPWSGAVPANKVRAVKE